MYVYVCYKANITIKISSHCSILSSTLTDNTAVNIVHKMFLKAVATVTYDRFAMY